MYVNKYFLWTLGLVPCKGANGQLIVLGDLMLLAASKRQRCSVYCYWVFGRDWGGVTKNPPARGASAGRHDGMRTKNTTRTQCFYGIPSRSGTIASETLISFETRSRGLPRRARRTNFYREKTQQKRSPPSFQDGTSAGYVGVARFELTISWSQTKRDTGLRYTPMGNRGREVIKSPSIGKIYCRATRIDFNRKVCITFQLFDPIL